MPGRCLVVQHAEAETAGLLASALARRHVEVDVRRVHAGDELPGDATGLAGLVVMGGPMSAASDDRFPTRRAELALLAGAASAGVPTLGVCLGAQLLAVAGGGDVMPGPSGPEVGWGEVQLTEAAADDVLLGGLSPTITVLHWHGDTFRTGPDMVLLASSEAYEAQAFRFGRLAWGLQFHLEVDAGHVEAFVSAFPEEAEAGQGTTAIRAGAAEALARMAPVAASVAERFAGLVVGASAAGRA